MGYAPFRTSTQTYKGTTFGFSFTINEDGSPLDLTTLNKVEVSMFSPSTEIFTFDNDSEGSLSISGSSNETVSGVADEETMDVGLRVYYMELRLYFADDSKEVYAVVDNSIIGAQSNKSQGAHDWVLDIDNDSETVTGQATSNLAEAIQAKEDAEGYAANLNRASIQSGDAGKIERIKSDESGWENVWQNIEAVNVRNKGASTSNTASQNETAIQSVIDNGDTWIYIPSGISYDPNNLTSLSDVIILDQDKNAIRWGKSVSLEKPLSSDSHLTLRGAIDDKHGALYLMTKGDYPVTPYSGGQYSSLKVFFDDYERAVKEGHNNYRDGGFTANDGGHNQAGVIRFNSKNNGDFMGAWQDIEFTMQNKAYNPLRILNLQPQNTNNPTSDPYYKFANDPYWYEGRSVSSGDLIVVNFRIYQAASSGTTGSTKPTHTSGTQSDGGVDWTFIEDLSPSNTGQRFRSTVFLGDTNNAGVDEEPAIGYLNMVAQIFENVGFAWDKGIQWFSGDKSEAAPYIGRISSSVKALFLQGDKSTSDGLQVGAGKVNNVGLRQIWESEVKNDGATEQDVSSTNIIKFNDSSATNFAGFTNGETDQIIVCRFNTANTTLVHDNSRLQLPNGNNITPGARTAYKFLMVNNDQATLIQ